MNNEPDKPIEESPLPASGPAASPVPGKPMSGRWIMAIAAAGAIALLTVPMLINAARPAGDRPRLAAAHGATCETEGMAKLDFTLKDPNGAAVNLADYKGKVILLNFWGTWCGPCKMEIPAFIELQDQYRARGFVILGLAVEDTPEAVRAYASEAKINYPLAMVQDDVEDAYGPIFALPMSFVIARDGSICKKHLGPVTKEAVEQEIRSLMQYDRDRMLKGFTHAHLACGCRIGFREGVEGSPVTVVVDIKGPGCPLTLHVRDLPLFDHREALRPSTRLLPPNEEEYEES